jgi:succinate dehydrogenase/fumarate reductase flavoprotein subunit
MADHRRGERFIIGNIPVEVYFFDAIVAGSGAAGFNAADTLLREGAAGAAMITESARGGASRNAGSDKQTYYKLSLAGQDQDSVRALAETLFSGQCMDGDLALCEAANSVSCFAKLALLGVPFPQNKYGEYAGYKTDHDPARRAASAGPYTSKFMTEALEKSARSLGLRIFDRMLIIELLVHEEQIRGALCLNLAAPEDEEKRFVVFWSPSVILATGGPAAMYGASVYPESQRGAGGAAFAAGVLGRNLTEWQCGLASVRPRWNVSGSYMQVLPRFVSTGAEGGGEREFLFDFFENEGETLSRVFLKGYQWPFDTRKLAGSSLIDALVFLETQKGRRVFLDFTHNPRKTAAVDYAALSVECRDYLSAAGACFGLPIDRLERMNRPAVEFYKDHGVDLRDRMLEIALSVQHNNGGLAVDHWWRTNIEGLFAVGEAAGTHGVYRPGGSALNAGQVGSYRAARYVAEKRVGLPNRKEILAEVLQKPLARAAETAAAVCRPAEKNSGGTGLSSRVAEARARMTLAGSAFRHGGRVAEALARAEDALHHFLEQVRTGSPRDLPLAFRFRDILISQYVYLSAMADYIEKSGKSRGSALYYHPGGTKPHPLLPDEFAFLPDDGTSPSMIQEIAYRDGACFPSWRPVRPIPDTGESFENVWSRFRETKNIE